MLGEEEKSGIAGNTDRKKYLRSMSWSDRSPSKLPNPYPKPQLNGKARSCLPPLQPLSIAKSSVKEWPRAGSDDLGVWPQPQTPRGSAKPFPGSNPEQGGREFEFKKDKLAFFDKECSRIAEHIYLGSDAVAKNREVLRNNGITHVLNCVGFVSPEYFKYDLVYKTLWLKDSPSEDITSILYDVFDYFEDVRKQNGRVFVHCCQGVSRSTSLVIAYLMWREGQSFQDAFQYVKAARGVTNPNMGFACQLLQCQKRVHAVPASPSSVLRMYRMAPHSSYDPLHLVPKMLNHPGAQGLDSRGAFVVHVPSAIYVWIGKDCNTMMSDNARAAALQVIQYERAKGPIVDINEGKEPLEFWDALSSGLSEDDCSKGDVKKEETFPSGGNKVAAVTCIPVGERKVLEYDLDFEMFHKALAGGVVPTLSVSNTESETCLPARENGWGRLRQKFASGIMKDLVSNESDMVVEVDKDTENPASLIEPSSPLSASSQCCGTPDSFECYPISSPNRISDTCREVGRSVALTNPLSFPTTDCGSPNSCSWFPDNNLKFSSKSPTLSPSTSEYSSSSFTFSPSSSNWSDLSCLSSQQPSPSGLDSADPLCIKHSPLADSSRLLFKESPSSPREALSADITLEVTNTCLTCKGISPSIAERRGSRPPPLMLLPSVEESPKVTRTLVRSWSFSLPDLDDDLMDTDCNQAENASNGDELMSGVDVNNSESDLHSAEVINPVLYQWPSLNKVVMHQSGKLHSRSAYLLLAPDATVGANKLGVLFVWLGRYILHEKGENATFEDSHLQWETIGRCFLENRGLPTSSPVQIVKEGEEPDEFLYHLSCKSLQKT
ncbi:protein-tyrosine-phosphatase MKP1-like isoform X2 [Argentina anserina]|uniref:protein-tyrosine-phosphatase MKP1-like isoform X1 n=1 Tax=Argentina anserina TaxID=57926 RepID=UPI0021768255|nr:protein-tyrosine-phosphatase MKP1-like isoform X1 [Potentilla anserina]XP_050372973.1 protein-tyrosine-phosphatase MKP1-like isoform X2 [Potentilla anserina]